MDNQAVLSGHWEDLPIEVCQKALMVYSPTTVNKLQAQSLLSKCPKTVSSHQFYDQLPDGLDGYEVYIGFGGGTAIDLAKFLSYKNPKSTCIAIPSMLSTNVFATNKTAAIYTDHKATIDSKLPEIVVKDIRALDRSALENLYGLADALSIHTASQDWLIADEAGAEPIHATTLGQSISILYKAKKAANTHTYSSSLTESIFQVLLEAGYITNAWGCGRPESGSEHIIAKHIEELVSVPHALSVTCGIAIASQLQDNPSATIELKKLGMFQAVKDSKITPEILTEALLRLQPRAGRYTVIDRFVNENGHLNPLLIKELISGSGLYD